MKTADSENSNRSGALPAVPEGASERSGYATVFFILLAASALFRLLYTSLVPLTGDELMHWQWARHLDLGYPEHPPLIAWSIAFTTTVFGHFEWSVRLVSVFAVTGVFWFAFQLGRELFGARAAFFGVVPLMATPLYNAGGVLANTDGLCAFFWTAAVYGFKKAAIDRRAGWWWLFGAATGLCMLTKLPGLYLWPAALLSLVGSAEGRAWLRRWQPWAAAALSLVFLLPPIIWNSMHGWHTVTMRVGHQVARGFTLKYTAELVGAQLLLLSPILFPWAVWALSRCWRHRADPRARLLGAFMAVPFLFYVSYSLVAKAGIHWLGLGYITGFVAAGAFTANLPRRRARLLLVAGVTPAVLLSTVLFVVPLAPELVSRGFAYEPRPDKVSAERLKDIFDWSILGTSIEELMDRGSEQSFILCRNNYGVAGSVAFYTPGQPEVFLWKDPGRNGAAYELWKRDAELSGWDAVVVVLETDPDWIGELECCFERLGEPQTVEIRRNGRLLKRYTLVHATNFSGFPLPPPGRQP